MKKTSFTLAKNQGGVLRPNSLKDALSVVSFLAFLLLGNFAYGQIMDPCPPGSGNMVNNCPAPGPVPMIADASCQITVPDFKPGVTGTPGPGYAAVGAVQLPMAGDILTLSNIPAGGTDVTVQVGYAFVDGGGMLCAELCPDVTLNVQDNTQPIVSCASPPAVSVGPSCSFTLDDNYVRTQLLSGLNDNCTDPGSLTLIYNPGPYSIDPAICAANSPFNPANPQPPATQHMITIQAQDAAGNLSLSCSATLTVIDDIAPDVTFGDFTSAPPGATFSGKTMTIPNNPGTCNGDIPDIQSYATITVNGDNCDPGPYTIDQMPAPGNYGITGCSRTYPVYIRVFDCHKNIVLQEYTIILEDQEDPAFTGNPCLEAMTDPDYPLAGQLFTDTNCDVVIPDLTQNIGANDNCNNPTTVTQDPPPGTYNIADICTDNTIDFVFTATDNCGNSTTWNCPDLLTAVDNTPPVIVCPADPITVVIPFNEAGTCDIGMAMVDLALLIAEGVTVTDNCDANPMLTNVTPNMFTCSDMGKSGLTVTIEAEDCSMNAATPTACAVEVVPDTDMVADWGLAGGDLVVCPADFPVCIELGANTPDCGSWSGDVAVSASAGCASTFELQAGSFPDLDGDGIPDPGDYSLTYTVGPPGCHVEVTHNVMVSPQFTADDAALVPDFSICLEMNEVFDLEGLLEPTATDGGVFTVVPTGAVTGNLTGSLWQYLGGDGTLEVTYTLTNCDGGTVSDIVIITIDEKPDGHFSMADDMCQDEPNETPTITGVPAGATVSFASNPAGFVINANTGEFDPSAGPLAGEFVDVLVTMTVTNGVCPTYTITETVRVYESGDPSFTLQATVCESDPPINLTLTNDDNDQDANTTNKVTDDNVTWTGTSVADIGATGTFDPSVGPGIYTVCVTVGAPSCEEIECHDITVEKDYTAAEVALIDDFTLCLLPDDIIDYNGLLAAGALPGGNFAVVESGTIIGTDNGNSYTYNGGCGTLTITHSFLDDCVPTSDEIVITIEERPQIGGFSVPGPMCAQDPAVLIDYTGTPEVCGVAGVFSGPGITDFGTGTTAEFDPAAAGEGVHTIFYEIGNPATGCFEFYIFDITVDASSSPNFTLQSESCANEVVALSLDSPDPSVLTTSPDGVAEVYWFGGDGLNAVVIDNGDGTGTFEGYVAGTYTVCVQTGDVGCSQFECHNITVDITPPVLDCGPLVRARDNDMGLCTFTMPGTGFDVTATDNCSPPNDPSSIILTHDYAPHVMTDENSLAGATFPVGITQVIWTATDTAGNSSNCTIEIVINDTEAPTVQSCPTSFSQGTDSDICGAEISYVIPQFADNCDGVDLEGVLVSGYAPGTDFPVGTTTVTWEYTDLADNGTATCTFTVTVNDDDDPNAVCTSAYDVVLDGDGLANYLADDVDLGSYDNCEIVSRLISRDGGVTFDDSWLVFCSDIDPALGYGIVPTILRVEDAAGNTSECTTDVYVYDVEIPDIECPGDYTVTANPSSCSAITTYPAPTVTDNCDVTISQITTFGGPASGDQEVPAVTTDATGTVSATLTDNGLLNLSVWFGGLSAPATAAHIHNAPAGSNGGVIVNLGPLGFPIGETAGLFNTSITLTAAQQTEYLAGNLYVNIHTSTNPGGELRGQLVSQGLTSGDEFPVGSTVQTYQAVDVAGNTEVCSFTILVLDEVAPTIDCGPAVRTRTADAGVCSFTMAGTGFDAVGADNCSAVTITHNYPFAVDPNTLAGSTFPVGSTTVTWIATDASGNQSDICGIEIIVTDDEDPTIDCGTGAPANLLMNGSYEANAGHDTYCANDWGCFGGAFVIDANIPGFPAANEGTQYMKTFGIGGLTQSVPASPGDEFFGSAYLMNASFDPMINPGHFGVVKLEFYDGGGGKISEVEGPKLFTADLPTNTWVQGTVNAIAPAGTASVLFVVVSVNPGPAGGAVMFDNANLNFGPGGVSGNVTVSNDPGECGAELNINNPDADDNCGIVSIINDYNYTTSASDFYPVGTTVVGFTATDAAGNTAECTITVTVEDTEAPTYVNCPTTMVMIGNDPDQCSGKLNWSIPVAEDNCELASNVQTAGPTNGTEVPVGMPMTVTYTATDIYNNSSECTFEVQVVDTQNPEFDADIVMPANVTVECDAVPAPFVLTNDDVFDNCTASADLDIDFDEDSTQDPDVNVCGHYNYTITRTWTVTDEAGNMLVHVQVITVQDTTPPVPMCADQTVTLDLFGNGSIDPVTVIAGTTDNCAPFSALDVTASQTNFTCADLGPNTVTLTITDPCGNEAMCDITVTVEEGIAPCTPEYDPLGSDPCVCLNNATNLDNGQFSEFIQIVSLAGQTWTVSSSSNLFAASSPAPPAAPTPIAAGTMLTVGNVDGVDNDNDGMTDEADEIIYYTIEAITVDGLQYTANLSNGIGGSITTSNVCFYPTPEFTNLSDPFCLNTPPFTPEVTDLYAGPDAFVSVSFLVNGVPATTVDPSALGIGNHTITVIADAGEAASSRFANGSLVPGDSATASLARLNPGCIQEYTEVFQVVTTPTQVTCNDQIQVSLEADCESVITQDMVLEGTYPCFDDYVVELYMPNGIPLNPSNVVTGAHVGITLDYILVHPISGNTCWGTVLVEDKIDPVPTCPPSVEILCTVDPDSIVYWLSPSPPNIRERDFFGTLVPVLNGSLLYLGEPTADDCSDWDWEYTDDYTSFDCAANPSTVAIIDRTFVVTDEWGNQSTCTQTITKLRGEFDQIDFPADLTIGCNDPNLPNLAPDFDPAVIGWPQIFGHNLTTTGTGICGLGITYDDVTVNLCANSYKVVRTWTVYDWCPEGGGAPTETEYVQYIKVENLAPVITIDCVNTDPTTGLCVLNATEPGNLPHYTCSAVFVPFAQVDAICDDLVEITVETPAGFTTNGGVMPSPGLPLGGPYTIIYRAEDQCGNITEYALEVLVKDMTAPIAVCDEITDVNLSSDGVAVVDASVFDDGSYDGCCLDELLVRRMADDFCIASDTIFGPNITFCCDDTDGVPVMVVFRAMDCHGNYNDCMVEVNVQDKTSPILITCPANTRRTCDWYANNLETQLANAADEDEQCAILDGFFGSPEFIDNCDFDVNCDVTINIDQCLEGFVRRTWSATDIAGNPSTQNCTQQIFIDHVSDWVVEFPEDKTIDCGTSVPDFGEPEIFFETCELVAVSYEDEVFTTVPDACYKILRTWTVINWCVVGEEIDQEIVEQSEHDLWTVFGGCLGGPNSPEPNCDLDNDGDCDEMTYRDTWNCQTIADGIINVDPTHNVAPFDTDDDPVNDSDPWDGYITYQQTIKVSDEVDPVFTDGCEIPDVCIGDNTCFGTVNLPEPAIDECSTNVTFQVSSDLGTGFGPFFNVEPGTYNVTYTAIDNCNNQTACETTVTVVDCKKPTPYCKNGIIVELMVPVNQGDEAMVEVWAVDLDANSFDNCTAAEDLQFSFSANVNDIGVTYNCADLGQQVVELWVTDEAGNQDFCETFVIIQANMNQCDDDPLVNVGGAINTEDNDGVEDVDVQLSGTNQMSVMTDANGMFNFNVDLGGDYTVTPLKDDNPLNGVTTFDLVLITKHILGAQLLDSPYKLIAADANKSNSVTTFDLVQLRKLILFIDTEFPNNTSWRFVDEGYTFPTPTNPWAEMFPEVVNYNNIDQNQLSADFVAVKIGDVNGSAQAFAGAAGDERTTTGALVFNVEDQRLEAGDTYTIEFTAQDFDVLGYQFTLNFDPTAVEFVEVESAVAGAENFGLTLLDQGAITTSWNENNVVLTDGEVVFSLVFKALKPTELSDVLTVNSRYTVAEAYKQNGEVFDVELAFNGTTVAGEFELYQNTPNPFSSSTVIGFHLPEAKTATLTISDVSGKVVKMIEVDGTKGYNEVSLERRELPAAGILYYQLDTDKDSATRMMLLID